MDDVTRDFIESKIDEILRKTTWTEESNCIHDEFFGSSIRELALGYAVGASYTLAATLLSLLGKHSEEDTDIIRTMIKQRLHETREKINRELYR